MRIRILESVPLSNGSICGSGRPTRVNSHKEVTKQKKSRFFLLFLLDDGRIRSRIREAQEHKDPTDPDRIPNIVGEERDGGCAQAHPSGVFCGDVLH
jgi:hypothetical protein